MADDSRMDAENRSIDEIMNQTELGSFLMKYRAMIVAVVVGAAVLLSGLGVYSHVQGKNDQEASAKVFEFDKNVYQKLIAGEVKAPEFATKLQALVAETGSFKGSVPMIITSSDYLISKGELASAKIVLEEGQKNFAASNHYTSFLINSRLATVYEDLGDLDKALSVLKGLSEHKAKFLEDKLYMDLGRLYLAKGDKEKAKLSLKYVVDKHGKSEFARVARVLLEDIEGK